MTLVIIPCGRSKIWSKQPNLGPTPAEEAYTGAPFKVNREYAETIGDRWIILSAKYGFIEPRAPIEQYEVTFKRKTTNPVSVVTIRKQLVDLGLLEFDRVVVLGGKEYRKVVEEAFAHTAAELTFPFSGLSLGKAMHSAKLAIAEKTRG
jgi:cytoplasmic iron level regulating protein YaaA (DUF328/UPF0246 family)